jgi:ribosomal protein S7
LGGANYQVPVEVRPAAPACRSRCVGFVEHARERSRQSPMVAKLAGEFSTPRPAVAGAMKKRG